MAGSGVPEEVFQIEIPRIAFANPHLYAIKVLGDGSCFFHSILRAFNVSYIQSDNISKRKELATLIRHATAASLEEKNPLTGKTEYESLGGGYYKNFNDAVKDVEGDRYSMEAMQRELLSSRPVDHAYIEILSNHLELDIYLISAKTGDVYTTGTELELYYRNRRSIVILYSPGHYDVLGIVRTNSGPDVVFDTLFAPSHEFIVALQKRLAELLNKSKEENPTPRLP